MENPPAQTNEPYDYRKSPSSRDREALRLRNEKRQELEAMRTTIEAMALGVVQAELAQLRGEGGIDVQIPVISMGRANNGNQLPQATQTFVVFVNGVLATSDVVATPPTPL